VRFTFEDGERNVLLNRLGLPADANDETLAERIAGWIAEDPNQNNGTTGAPGVEGQTGAPPEDTGDFVVVDVASYRRMQSQEEVAAAVVEANRVRDRNELIDEAIHDGKFGPGRRDHYLARYDSDPEGTKTLIARLMKNTVPLEARGVDAPTDDVEDDSYPSSWVPEVAARAANADGGVVTSPGGPQVRRNRVHSEQ
jgi:hypothetical protein